MSEDVLAWALIGAACSLAGMIYPFRRGLAGVAVNVLAGVGGGVALGILSWMAFQGSGHYRRDWSLPFAAAGALGAIALVHVSYVRWVRAKRG